MKKNIMITDDSALMRRVMCDIIESDSTFQVTEVCRDGLEAYEKLKTVNVDAMILDVTMPRMDGLELLQKLQRERKKIVVIMASTLTTEGSEVTLRALELGAVDFVTKPTNIIEAKGADFKSSLLEVLHAVLRTKSLSAKSYIKPISVKMEPKKRIPGRNKVVALACSTGGPKSLQSVIPFLPKNLDAPMVLVQHMPKGFTKSMADRLNELSEISVCEASEGDVLQKGVVYVAPGGKHLEIVKDRDGHKVHLSDAPPVGGLRPCADIMYESLKNSSFDEVICVVLTGMGADGTRGILSLQERKSIYTISQDEASCVVYGMPKAIAETGIVNEVVTLTSVAKSIISNVGVR